MRSNLTLLQDKSSSVPSGNTHALRIDVRSRPTSRTALMEKRCVRERQLTPGLTKLHHTYMKRFLCHAVGNACKNPVDVTEAAWVSYFKGIPKFDSEDYGTV